MASSSFCLTNTIDRYSDIGYRYYHNIQQQTPPNPNKVIMRPRLPLRFDFNDVEIVKMDPKDPKTNNFIKHYQRFSQFQNLIKPDNLYRVKRTGYSIFNTFLLYFLSIMLIVTSVINMKKIINAMQHDTSLNLKDKMMFRLSFVFSFLVILFLSCFMGLSTFELWRNMDRFSVFNAHNFRYKNLKIQDGNMYFLRYMILFFVSCTILFIVAETLNLFLMKPNKPSILILFVPICLCFFLFIHSYPRRNVV